MDKTRLYDLAFAHKKTKLWERIGDSRIFAVKLSGERTGYIRIPLPEEDQHSLCLYIGEKGLDSLSTVWKADHFLLCDLNYEEYFLYQECLQCVFSSKEGVPPEDLVAVRVYACSQGIRLAGKYAYPRFEKCQSFSIPWKLQTQEEEEDLGQALEAANEMSRLLEDPNTRDSVMRGFWQRREGRDTVEIPILKKAGEGYVLEKMELPRDRPQLWREPKGCNDIRIAGLRKMKKQGIWECELVRLPDPIQEDPEEIPVFPFVLLTAESGSGCLLPIQPVKNYEKEQEKLLNLFLDGFARQGICPKELKVKDDRTYSLVKLLEEKLKISVWMEKELPALEDAKFDFLESYYMTEEEQLEELFEMMEILEDMPWEKIPGEIRHQLDILMSQGLIPDLSSLTEEWERAKAEVKRLDNSHWEAQKPGIKNQKGKNKESKNQEIKNQAAKNQESKNRETKNQETKKQKGNQTELEDLKPENLKSENIKSKNTKSETKGQKKKVSKKGSYVISVSLGTGYYRHLRVPKGYTLLQLHALILDAFDFFDDHAHAFFMDNKAWSDRDSYYASEVAEHGERTTAKCPLSRLGLHKGMAFKYVFDFGDEWMFQCKVLRVEEEDMDEGVVIKQKGEAPSQYPDWNEDEDDWDEDWDEDE